MKHRYMTLRICRVVRFMRPGISCRSFRVTVKGEHFHDAIPNGLSLPSLFHRHGFSVRRVHTVKFANNLFQRFDMP